MSTLTKLLGACGVQGCESCKPHRVAHWHCAQCGGGPYKFAATDPGPYKVLRPHFERNSQKFVMRDDGVGHYEYTVRRICSAGCWQRETRRVSADEMALAQRRPDLAPAIEAKVQAEHADFPPEVQDDLGMNPGSY